jgi:hypothetical protein
MEDSLRHNACFKELLSECDKYLLKQTKEFEEEAP